MSLSQFVFMIQHCREEEEEDMKDAFSLTYGGMSSFFTSKPKHQTNKGFSNGRKSRRVSGWKLEGYFLLELQRFGRLIDLFIDRKLTSNYFDNRSIVFSKQKCQKSLVPDS